ncbi:hydroxyphenylacetyl-CoA thioesterase PaaI [Paracoccus sediminicola]|uniref:hydroxyphenylacetyl-CoA thioesterase PaaI n=1 Tax=Paracoccus sediminicola TaxID=3017783 RepID=UPI0022F092A5|nr:hydroxyphenylacetyl-CoA thioesterase PaaI [Paracoccus sediminicola]WBU58336.1 hydroxyphenylacetyl-CoA thioesterase PaaI [Paracoccus sediminicola]
MTPQQIAEASAQAMWDQDRASQRLGMRIERIAPGEATLSMEITEAMTNGHDNAHGGYIFTLADSAFAFACNTYNAVTVGQQASINYVAPGRLGDVLTATAREASRSGRSGVYDVEITNQNGQHVAHFRGLSRSIKGSYLPE